LTATVAEGGFALPPEATTRRASVGTNGSAVEIGHGAVVIAAITSCTNTSNPSVLITAGLLARNALRRGLHVPPYVKTSLAPGSRVVSDYLRDAGLLEPLADLGFNVVGYGCTTCIGNSGPLPGEVVRAIGEGDLASAVLSGNRNFEGRINPHVRASYLASPPLVVALALAGTTDVDLTRDPLGIDAHGQPVFMRDLWPSSAEVQTLIEKHVAPELFRQRYAEVSPGMKRNALPVSAGDLYAWDPASTSIQEPPFFEGLTRDVPPLQDVTRARARPVGRFTTDAIQGSADGPAGRPIEQGAGPRFTAAGAGTTG
jgi:aconitate hydratase